MTNKRGRPMEGWYTYYEAAEELGVAPHTFMKRIRRGYVEGMQRGSTWFVHKDEVDRIREEMDAKRALVNG
jgi:excisionase family DNA binding protein